MSCLRSQRCWSLLGALNWICLALSLLALAGVAGSQEMYKYRDEQGNWVYTDRKPRDVEEIETSHLEKAQQAPEVRLEWREAGGVRRLVTVNEYHAPVEVAVLFVDEEDALGEIDEQFRFVVPALRESVVKEEGGEAPVRGGPGVYRHVYVLGDPKARHGPERPYRVPYSLAKAHRVSQAYPGEFSHTDPSSLYAVDFEMPVGTALHAAREGVVIEVAAHFFRSGTDFKQLGPRANIVRILHDDGTMAVYAHLKWDSIRVRPGDDVERGEYIADSGNTGFSTGPHLHFAVQRNSGLATTSIRFEFENELGRGFYPAQGDTITAY